MRLRPRINASGGSCFMFESFTGASAVPMYNCMNMRLRSQIPSPSRIHTWQSSCWQQTRCHDVKSQSFFKRAHRDRSSYRRPFLPTSQASRTLSTFNFQHPQTLVTVPILQEILQGVVTATKAPEDVLRPISTIIPSVEAHGNTKVPTTKDSEHRVRGLPYCDWSATIESALQDFTESKQLAFLALGIAVLRENSRSKQVVTVEDLATIWEHIYAALNSSWLSSCIPGPSRSAQGFVAVPLCSLIRDGQIETLFRLHVWLPDRQRGAPGFAIHSHQPFAQSWILAGEGQDIAYEVSPVTTRDLATHAEYALAWTDSKDKTPDGSYKTHQVSSSVMNTKRWVSAKVMKEEVHTRDMSYHIHAASFHATKVSPDSVHATLFLFDSASGFIRDAPILGPVDLESSVQLRDSGGLHSRTVASIVEAIRNFEDYLTISSRFAKQKDYGQAIVSLRDAYHAYQQIPDTFDLSHYDRLLTDQLGRMTISMSKQGILQGGRSSQHFTDLGIDWDAPDELGFSILDHARSDDKATVGQLLLKAVKRQRYAVNSSPSESLMVTSFQKQYREVYLDTIRPILDYGHRCSIHEVRRAYVSARSAADVRSRLFGQVRYVPYNELLGLGRFPRASVDQVCMLDGTQSPYIIFFSYQWRTRAPWAAPADDTEHMLYQRTIRATEEFLHSHRAVDRNDLGIWIDVACVDQADPLPGISALPMIVAQCNALISLVDEGYHDRAWCSVEVMMALALRKRCKLYEWYEFREDPIMTGKDTDMKGGGLTVGPENLNIEVASKRLSLEGDRRTVVFLEGLSRLL